MAAKKLTNVDLERGVHHTRDDGTTVFYPPGINVMPVDDAEHWYIKGHMKADPPPMLGDEAFALSMRQHADEKRAEYEAIEAQAVEAEEAWNNRKGKSADELAAEAPADGEVRPDPVMLNEGNTGPNQTEMLDTEVVQQPTDGSDDTGTTRRRKPIKALE